MPSNDVSHPYAGSNVFHYVGHMEISDYTFLVPVGFIFVPEITCVLHVPVSAGSVIASHAIGGKRHSVYGDVWIPFSCIVPVSDAADTSLHVPRVFGSNVVSGVFSVCTDSVLCARGVSTNTCCPE